MPVIVKSAGELNAIISDNPIDAVEHEHSRFLVACTQDAMALSGLAAVQSLVLPPEKFAVGKHAAYLLRAAGILESKAAESLLGKAAKSATTRNWATVLKLQALASERGA